MTDEQLDRLLSEVTASLTQEERTTAEDLIENMGVEELVGSSVMLMQGVKALTAVRVLVDTYLDAIRANTTPPESVKEISRKLDMVLASIESPTPEGLS